MDYSDEYLREYLPAENPPPGYISEEIESEIGRRFESPLGDHGLVSRATRWTYAVFSEFGLGQFQIDWRSPFSGHEPGPLEITPLLPSSQISFGLFDREFEHAGLGVIVNVPRYPGPPFIIAGYAEFQRLGGESFPIAIRQSEIDLHLDHPCGATSACWAQCRSTSLWGILTAGHAVGGSRPGRAVPLATGGTGTLLRSHFQPVDAAFVVVPAPSIMLTPLSVVSFPSVGMGVTIECQGGPSHRTIVEVMNNCGVLHTRAMGILVYLDTPANPGDSGALVRVAGGDAVGLYKGSMKLPGPAKNYRGLAQNFEQAVFALDVHPYL